MKRLFVAVLLTLLPVLAYPEQRTADFALHFDADSTTATYCAVTGMNGDPFGQPIQSKGALKTTGSSATVDEAVSGEAPFNELSVGDIIFVYHTDATTDIRWIIAKASGSQVTVNAAVDWSAHYPFRWKKQTCGTTATSGWVDVSKLGEKVILFDWEAGVTDTAGIDVIWQCKTDSPGATAVQVYPFTGVRHYADAGVGTAANKTALVIPEPWGSCRVGVALTTGDDGAGDATTNMEDITITLTGIVQRAK